MMLGEILGFDSGKVENEGSPDPWWIAADACLVFEDHAGAGSNAVIDVKKARQASSHPNWMRQNVPASAEAKILPVLVTPAKRVSAAAVVHLDGVALWPLDKMKQWAEQALATVRQVRQTFIEPGDLNWRSKTAEAFQQNNISARPLFEALKKVQAARVLQVD
jgi:hypothetical protein